MEDSLLPQQSEARCTQAHLIRSQSSPRLTVTYFFLAIGPSCKRCTLFWWTMQRDMLPYLLLFSSMVLASTRALVLSSFLIFSTFPCRSFYTPLHAQSSGMHVHSCLQCNFPSHEIFPMPSASRSCSRKGLPLDMQSTSSAQSPAANFLIDLIEAPCTDCCLSAR